MVQHCACRKARVPCGSFDSAFFVVMAGIVSGVQSKLTGDSRWDVDALSL